MNALIRYTNLNINMQGSFGSDEPHLHNTTISKLCLNYLLNNCYLNNCYYIGFIV